ncbi:MAG: protein kinase domain-containing protein [Fimbriiglobus sp.]
MADDPRVQQLLNELLDSDSTPEVVCSSCVELLPVVRDRWRQICHARVELDALFPAAVNSSESLPKPLSDATALPTIPGYEVDAVLGVGGMGVVFRARHLRLNRLVALKMALAGVHAGPNERERFQREAEAVAALHHANIVQIHDIGDAGGRPYFTMEYIDGGTLGEQLTGQPWLPREAATLIAILARAAHAAHENGIVHRDLKPENIFLTTDGLPKIGDFGLAQRFAGEAGLTRTGTALGTPSYMAPEQAGESTEAVGPSADVYALGSILYELLTGKPPFVAARADVTLYQVLTRDPEPPSRRNAKVPRDLETICLKCLYKEPRFRYITAASLEEDLNRFLDGEAVEARPEGKLARLLRRVRRRPVLSVAITMAVISTFTLIVGGMWAIADRRANQRSADLKQAALDADLRAIEQASETDLLEMEDSLRRCSWPMATAALERAKSRLSGRGSADLHQRIERGTCDLELVTRWEEIRLNSFVRHDSSDGHETIDVSQSDQEFEEAFRTAGLGRVNDSPEAVAERLRGSFLRNFLAPELDYWAMMNKPDSVRRKWLLDVARRAEEDPTGWSAQAMILANWRNETAIGKLIETAPSEYPPLLIMSKIHQAMTRLGKDPIPMMRRYQQAHSNHFWVNLLFADTLSTRKKPEDAIRYYQAALAIRPRTSLVCNNLGIALAATGHREEAVEQYRRAIEYDPSSRLPRANLAVLLSRMNRHKEAIEVADVTLSNDSSKNLTTAGVYTALGHSLKATGKDAESVEAFRKAIAIDARNLTAQSGLRAVLTSQGKLVEVKNSWREALKADPPEHNAWYGYAELCLYLGDEEEYRYARRALLAKFAKVTDPYIAERTSRAALLLPVTGKELEQAASLARRAATADREKHLAVYAHFQFARGLAEYREGQFRQAITTLRKDAAQMPGPMPRLVLALALYRDGQEDEARKSLATAIQSHDWRETQIKNQDGWMAHFLRREAEAVIQLSLPGKLDGKRHSND